MCSLISVAEAWPGWWGLQGRCEKTGTQTHSRCPSEKVKDLFSFYFFKMGGDEHDEHPAILIWKCRVPWFWPCVLSFPLQKNRDMIGWRISRFGTCFPYIGNVIIPIDFHLLSYAFIFFRGIRPPPSSSVFTCIHRHICSKMTWMVMPAVSLACHGPNGLIFCGQWSNPAPVGRWFVSLYSHYLYLFTVFHSYQ